MEQPKTVSPLQAARLGELLDELTESEIGSGQPTGQSPEYVMGEIPSSELAALAMLLDAIERNPAAGDLVRKELANRYMRRLANSERFMQRVADTDGSEPPPDRQADIAAGLF